jgi:DNA invertase Pin-like site-specific DNA recombinase
LLELVEQLKAKGVALRILSMGGSAGPLDTSNPTAKLTLTLLGAVAEFERSIMLERQREGIAKAKAEGKYQGRAPTAQRQADKVVAMRAEGHKPRDIAETLGIGRASVFGILKAHREAASAAEAA